MEWKSLFSPPSPTVWPIWDPEAFLKNGTGTDLQPQSPVPCPSVCHNCCLIYAASWMQLLPVSTVPKKLRVANSLKDWRPLLAYIYRAHHRCVDCRWILCPRLGGISLGNFGNQTFTFLPPQPFLFLFHFPSLHPLQWCNSRSQAPSVYSLYPDRKDIRLSDQRARAGARRINEASGWREGGREKGRGRLGQVGWQAHNQRRNRWGLLLSSDKRLQPSSEHTKPDPCWQELLFPMLMSSVLVEVTLQKEGKKEKRGMWCRKQQDSIWFICFCDRCLLKSYVSHMGIEYPLMWCDKCSPL